MRYQLPRVWKGEALRFQQDWEDDVITDRHVTLCLEETNLALFNYVMDLAEKQRRAALTGADIEVAAAGLATYWLLTTAAQRRRVVLPVITQESLDSFVDEFWQVTDFVPDALRRKMNFDNPQIAKGLLPLDSPRLEPYQELGMLIVYGALQKQAEVDLLHITMPVGQRK